MCSDTDGRCMKYTAKVSFVKIKRMTMQNVVFAYKYETLDFSHIKTDRRPISTDHWHSL